MTRTMLTDLSHLADKLGPPGSWLLLLTLLVIVVAGAAIAARKRLAETRAADLQNIRAATDLLAKIDSSRYTPNEYSALKASIWRVAKVRMEVPDDSEGARVLTAGQTVAVPDIQYADPLAETAVRQLAVNLRAGAVALSTAVVFLPAVLTFFFITGWHISFGLWSFTASQIFELDTHAERTLPYTAGLLSSPLTFIFVKLFLPGQQLRFQLSVAVGLGGALAYILWSDTYPRAYGEM